jgi:hypothetical protein
MRVNILPFAPAQAGSDAIADLPALGRRDAARSADVIVDRFFIPVLQRRYPTMPRYALDLLVADARLQITDFLDLLIRDHVNRADIARMFG